MVVVAGLSKQPDLKSLAVSGVGAQTGRVLKPTLLLTVGLPGTGKTSMAKSLAARQRILRLTPDDWMAPLFGHSDAAGRRDVLEGRMIWVALQLIAGGSSVILDFGCWSSDERYAIRSLAESTGGRFELMVAAADEPERRRRAERRWAETPEETFPMSAADHDRFLAHYQPPTAEELGYAPIPRPPDGAPDWRSWACGRWPALPATLTW